MWSCKLLSCASGKGYRNILLGLVKASPEEEEGIDENDEEWLNPIKA